MVSTRKRDRIFAGFGAFLFLASACALSIFVILQPSSSSNNTPTCTFNTVAASTAPTPEVYKPTGTVTSLQSTDLVKGTGATAQSGSCLVVKYYGTLASDGSVFDENYDQSTALEFPLGQGQVIQGWDQGLLGMKVGGVRRLVIPASLGYGAAGSPPKIPANATLVFVVKLLKIQN